MECLIGKRIKMLRTSNGYSQGRLALLINSTKGNISHYETNMREPDIKTLIALADVFEVSIDYLLGRTDIQKPFNSLDHKESYIINSITKCPELKSIVYNLIKYTNEK